MWIGWEISIKIIDLSVITYTGGIMKWWNFRYEEYCVISKRRIICQNFRFVYPNHHQWLRMREGEWEVRRKSGEGLTKKKRSKQGEGERDYHRGTRYKKKNPKRVGPLPPSHCPFGGKPGSTCLFSCRRRNLRWDCGRGRSCGHVSQVPHVL